MTHPSPKHDKCYLEERMSKLEWTQKEMVNDLRDVRVTAASLSVALSEITSCLNQIKFTAFGAIGMLILNTIGVGDAVSLILTK